MNQVVVIDGQKYKIKPLKVSMPNGKSKDILAYVKVGQKKEKCH